MAGDRGKSAGSPLSVDDLAGQPVLCKYVYMTAIFGLWHMANIATKQLSFVGSQSGWVGACVVPRLCLEL